RRRVGCGLLRRRGSGRREQHGGDGEGAPDAADRAHRLAPPAAGWVSQMRCTTYCWIRCDWRSSSTSANDTMPWAPRVPPSTIAPHRACVSASAWRRSGTTPPPTALSPWHTAHHSWYAMPPARSSSALALTAKGGAAGVLAYGIAGGSCAVPPSLNVSMRPTLVTPARAPASP